MTLLVNLFSGPSGGKTTMRADLFRMLKQHHITAEEAPEVAKTLSWEERKAALSCQPYVTGTQLFHIERLMGKADVVITDSPILLGSVYGEMNSPGKYPRALYQFFEAYHLRNPALDVFIERQHAFEDRGRIHTEEQAREIDRDILRMLNAIGRPFMRVPATDEGTKRVFDAVMERLRSGTAT